MQNFAIIRQKLKPITQQFFPHICVLCNDIAPNRDICPKCFEELPWIIHACERCALPLTNNVKLCDECETHPPPFENARTLWHYAAPIDFLLTQLKFNQRLVYARLLGEIMASQMATYYLSSSYPNCIIPMPLSSIRLTQRGFNQVVELTKPLVKKLAIPIEIKGCTRVRHTVAQSELTALQRRVNLLQAFQTNKDFSGQHVVVIDDIMTTGCTVTEVTHTLKKAGAGRVDIWCFARTNISKNH